MAYQYIRLKALQTYLDYFCRFRETGVYFLRKIFLLLFVIRHYVNPGRWVWVGSPIALTRRDVRVVAFCLGCHPRDYINLRADAAGPDCFFIFESNWRIGEKMDRMYWIIIIGICCMWGYLISFPARVRIISKIEDRNIKIIIDGLEVCPKECHGSRIIE